MAEPQVQLIGEAHCNLANKRENPLPAMLSCTRAFHPGPVRCWGAGTALCPTCLPAPSRDLAGLRRQVEGPQGRRITAELPCSYPFTCLHNRLPCPPPLFWEAWSLPASLQGDTGGWGRPNLQLHCFPERLLLGCKSPFI